ncbi:hypothetical protein Mapa_009542 [Marchantia paleacea]|nr:hypothetical protein Mapa_009542 [Marchantia paleacea]
MKSMAETHNSTSTAMPHFLVGLGTMSIIIPCLLKARDFPNESLSQGRLTPPPPQLPSEAKSTMTCQFLLRPKPPTTLHTIPVDLRPYPSLPPSSWNPNETH